MEYFYDNYKKRIKVARVGLANTIHELYKEIKSAVKKDSDIKNFQLRGMTFSYYLDDGFLHEVHHKRSDAEYIFDGQSLDVKANGIDSIYLGRHYIRSGGRPQTYSKIPEAGLGFWYKFGANFSNLDKEVAKIDVNDALIVHGNFYTNKVTLQRTMIPEVAMGNELPKFYNDLSNEHKRAIKATIRKLRLPDLTPCNISDMYSCDINYESKAGFRYESYLQMNNKREAVEVATNLAKIRWNYIEYASRKGIKLEREKLIPSYYTVGARNKKEISKNEYSESNSRAIHMPEFHCELNSSPWVDKITEHLLREQSGPIYIGNNILKYERFERDISNSKFTVEGDWKRFDSTIYIQGITIAVSILRCYFVDNNKRVDYHILALYDTASIKDYIIPGGYIYRLFHGIPSGIKATSILGSIICLYSLVFCLIKLDIKKIKFIIGGDDHVIVVDKVMNVRSELKENIIKLRHGFEVFKIEN